MKIRKMRDFFRKYVKRGFFRKCVCGFFRKCVQKRPRAGRVALFSAAAALSLLLLICATRNASVPADKNLDSLAASSFDRAVTTESGIETVETAELAQTTEQVVQTQTETTLPTQTETAQNTTQAPSEETRERPSEAVPTQAISVYSPVSPGMMENSEDEDGATPEDLIGYYWYYNSNEAGATDEDLRNDTP